MKKSGVLLLLALFCLFLLAACGSEDPGTVAEDNPANEIAVAEATAEEASAEAAAEEVAPTATETVPPPPTETAVPATATVEPTATEEAAAAAEEEEAPPTPTVEPTLEPNPEVLESNCLSCHSNKELLMDLAEPEEEPEESESSGVG